MWKIPAIIIGAIVLTVWFAWKIIDCILSAILKERSVVYENKNDGD